MPYKSVSQNTVLSSLLTHLILAHSTLPFPPTLSFKYSSTLSYFTKCPLTPTVCIPLLCIILIILVILLSLILFRCPNHPWVLCLSIHHSTTHSFSFSRHDKPSTYFYYSRPPLCSPWAPGRMFLVR